MPSLGRRGNGRDQRVALENIYEHSAYIYLDLHTVRTPKISASMHDENAVYHTTLENVRLRHHILAVQRNLVPRTCGNKNRWTSILTWERGRLSRHPSIHRAENLWRSTPSRPTYDEVEWLTQMGTNGESLINANHMNSHRRFIHDQLIPLKKARKYFMDLKSSYVGARSSPTLLIISHRRRLTISGFSANIYMAQDSVPAVWAHAS